MKSFKFDHSLLKGQIRKVTSLLVILLLTGIATGIDAQVRVACIGNSITYGSGIENREKYSYPAQLQDILGDAWDVRNFGVSGRTMLKKGDHPLWNEETFAQALAFKPDVVIIKLGTNDSKDFNWKYSDEFKSDYQAMIDTFKMVSDPAIFVCMPVPAFGDRWNIDSTVIVNEVIPMVRQVAYENQLPVINLFDPFKDKSDLFPDRIHPDAHGAALMAGIISRYLVADLYSILEKSVESCY